MRKWIAYNTEFLDDKQAFRLTNGDFQDIRRDDIAGKIDIDIQVSTAEDNASKAQELSFMLQTMGPNMEPIERRMLQAEIAKLYKMPDLAKKIEEFEEPQPNPLQVKEMELKVALLEAQVMNERAKGQENAVDVELKTAKTQTELAKAKDLSSTADLKDLDFLAKDNNQAHIQEMEKKEFDRRSNEDAKVLDSIINAKEGS